MDTKGTMKNAKATREIKQDTSIIKLNSLWIFTYCLKRFRFYTWKKYMHTKELEFDKLYCPLV